MAEHYLRKYGSIDPIEFVLWETDNTDLMTTASFAVGDVKLMKDEGAETDVINLPVDRGQGYSWTPSSAELQCARAVLYIVDQSTKTWRDQVLIIDTYGHTNAQHAMDLDKDIANKDGNYTYDQTTDSLEAIKDLSASLSEMADSFHDEAMEGTLTFRQIVRILLSALGGKTTNSGTRFRDNADSKNRIEATVDGSGNRTSVTLDGS